MTANVRSRKSRLLEPWTARVARGACAALLLATGAAAHAHGGGGPGACTRTAKAALAACRHEVKDDYWIAIGKCENAGAGERKACTGEAAAERRAAAEECKEQLSARLELCEAVGEAPYDPEIDPGRFLDPKAIAANPNPYFPLVPGTTRVYQGGDETIVVQVTDQTTAIEGVPAIAVRDTVTVGDEVVEDTVDWFAQDRDGTVWYFGEISQEFEEGELVSLEGSWKAGRDGAKPGIVMLADPRAGVTYRQEWALGNAEDAAEVLETGASASTPGASCEGTCVVTRDFTPISPGAEEHKYYAPGVGLILEVNPETGDRVELVALR